MILFFSSSSTPSPFEQELIQKVPMDYFIWILYLYNGLYKSSDK